MHGVDRLMAGADFRQPSLSMTLGVTRLELLGSSERQVNQTPEHLATMSRWAGGPLITSGIRLVIWGTPGVLGGQLLSGAVTSRPALWLLASLSVGGDSCS